MTIMGRVARGVATRPIGLSYALPVAVGSSRKENSLSFLEQLVKRLCLHHLVCFVHRDLATTLQNGAAFGHLGSRVQRIRLNNGVPTG